MEKMEEKGNHVARKKGGLVTMPFIFANEICEKLAVVGFNANMISYLTTQLHMPLTKAANTLSNVGGTASLIPLLGASLFDAYAGHFWTIAIASIIYQFDKTDQKQTTKIWNYFNWYYFVMGFLTTVSGQNQRALVMKEWDPFKIIEEKAQLLVLRLLAQHPCSRPQIFLSH
ncbi:hypothetical protein L3X38_028161 [Prunus dulcis]|uniref:Major facilitator superfamily protein n=1 Tax=Prunus dulcis TaxID=3755 RepID=A0AAD4Z165_PRUDU|nr:hypothetical protein L3X38_028161 [Prunus dulcis]